MINQNNSKSLVSVNRSLSNKKVQEFAQLDQRIIQRKKQEQKQLRFQEGNEKYHITSSQESSFDEEFDDDEKNPNDIIEEIYQLKKKEQDLNSSHNSSKILPNVYSKLKSEKSIQEQSQHKLNRQTSIKNIHLTQNDDSILSDNNSQQKKKHNFTQRNLNSQKISEKDLIKTQAKVKCSIKKISKPKVQEQDEKLPQIWQQYYNILPDKEKSKIKKSFVELNNQFKEMEKERVLEPFLKDQKLKVKLMTPLVIRKDKPYYVAENKDNKNLIDNMKNENTNLNRDEYLIVSYEQILDYI